MKKKKFKNRSLLSRMLLAFSEQKFPDDASDQEMLAIVMTRLSFIFCLLFYLPLQGACICSWKLNRAGISYNQCYWIFFGPYFSWFRNQWIGNWTLISQIIGLNIEYCVILHIMSQIQLSPLGFLMSSSITLGHCCLLYWSLYQQLG